MVVTCAIGMTLRSTKWNADAITVVGATNSLIILIACWVVGERLASTPSKIRFFISRKLTILMCDGSHCQCYVRHCTTRVDSVLFECKRSIPVLSLRSKEWDK